MKTITCPRCHVRFDAGASPGDVVQCPGCKGRLRLAPKTAAPPGKPAAPAAPIEVTCDNCFTVVKVAARLAGTEIECSKCHARNVVPGKGAATEQTYGFHSAPAEEAPEPLRLHRADNRPRPTDADWCVPGYGDLPEKTLAALDRARRMARKSEWSDAVSLLDRMIRAHGRLDLTRQNYHARKPLAFCLAQQSLEELEELQDDDARLSRPVRRVIRQALDTAKWGGDYPATCVECGNDVRPAPGMAAIRTSAGTAFLCCTAPTPDDVRLVRQVNGLWKRLTLAIKLDGENADAPRLLAHLPPWYPVLYPEQVRGKRIDWWTVPGTAAAVAAVASAGFGAAVGEAIGEAVGEIIAEAVVDALFNALLS